MAEDTTNRLAGIASIQVGGVTYLLQGELSYSPSKVTRETLAGQDQVHGFKEMPVASFISGSLRDTNNLTVADFNQMTNVTISLSLANGKQVVGRNMWCTGVQEVKTQEATFEVKFEGTSVTEVL
jgi:hypothetical protein